MRKKWPKIPQKVWLSDLQLQLAPFDMHYFSFWFFFSALLLTCVLSMRAILTRALGKEAPGLPAAVFSLINARSTGGKRSWMGAMPAREIREHILTKTCLNYSIYRAWWVGLSPEPRQCMTSAGGEKAVHRGGAKLKPSIYDMFPVGRATANLFGCGYQCFTNKGQMLCDISSFLWSRGGSFIEK